MALEPQIGVVEVALHEEFSAGVVKVALHRVVLLSLLESLNNLGSNSLYLLFRNLELLVFLQVSCLSALRSSPKTLTFSLMVLALSMVEMRSFFNLEFSAFNASILDTTDTIFGETTMRVSRLQEKK